MDALALGGAVAAAFRVPSAASWTLDHRGLLIAASVLSLLAGAVISRGYHFADPMTLSLGLSFLAIAFALLVAAGVVADRLGAAGWLGALRWSFLRRVAKYSYAMYVLSVPLHFLVGKPALSALGLDPGSPVVGFTYIIVGTALSFVAAAASFHFFEVHFLKLKDRLAP
jgi:peptidoglycan/LPS O-acetylase OafA/YrhL